MGSIADKARLFAKAKHMGQTRRDGKTPYFNHCMAVADLVESDYQKAVAYCHDLIEEGRATYEEIEQKLDATVALNVLKLTHYPYDSYEEYISRFKEHLDELAKIVKIADIVANLTDKPTLTQKIKYYRALKILCGV